MNNLLSDLQRRYHDLLNPVSQGLSQIGKAVVNSTPALQGAKNTINFGQNLLQAPQFKTFSKPIVQEGKNFVKQQLPAVARLSPPGQLIQSINNFQNPNFNPTQNAINQGKDLFQGGKFVANVVGAPKVGLTSLGLSAGLGGTINKVLGGSFAEGAGQGVAVTPMISGIGSVTNPLIEKYTQLLAPKVASKLLNNKVGNYLATSTLRGLQNVPEGAVMNASMGLNPLDPGNAALNFAGGFIPGRTGINSKVEINPNETPRMAKQDLEDAAKILERIALRDDPQYYMSGARVKDQKFIRQIAEDYINKKFANQKDFQAVAQEVANRVRVEQNMPHMDLPGGMGLVEGGEFKPPYKPGDIKKLQQGVKDELSTMQRTDPKQSRIQELEYYAKQGNEEAKAQLELVNNMQAEVEKAKTARLGKSNVAQQPVQKIVSVKPRAQIKAEIDGTIASKKLADLETTNQQMKLYTQPGSITNTRVDQIAKKFRNVDSFEAEMDAQVGKPVVIKPSGKRQPMKLPGDTPQYSQSDSNFEAGKSQMRSEEDKGRFDQLFAEWVGKRDAARTRGTELGAKFKEIAPGETREFAKKVETGQETKYSKEVRTELDKVFNDAKANGIELGYRENYLPHVWDKSETQVMQDYKVFKKREGFQNERVLPTYEEGIQMGLNPKYKTVGELLSDYGDRVEKLKSNLDFFKKMKDEGFIVDASIGARQPGFQALDGQGFPRSISKGIDGQTVIGNYYAPIEVARKINKVFSPQESNKILGTLRKISGIVQDVTLSGGAPGTPFNAFTLAQIQKELLSGRIKSPFSAFFRSLSTGKSTEFFQNNVGQIKKMQERNIPISSSYEIGQLVSGGDKGNIWNRAVNDPTFKRFMPQLQINLFNDIEKQALKGGRTSSEAADIAAKAVKQFYGITGTEKEILRGQTGKDLLGATTFAPKFRESMINFWINSVKALKNPTALENRANIKFLAGATLTLGAMDYMNNQLNGHHMWDNPEGKQDKLLIPLGDGTVVGLPFLSSIATIPRAIAREAGQVAKGDITGAAVDAGSTYASVIAKPIFDVVKNSDYFGKEIVSENDNPQEKFSKIGKYMLTQYLAHPYIKETFDPRNTEDPAYQRISRALELPIRYYSQKSIDSADYFAARDEAYQKLDKTQRAAFDAIPKQDPQDPLARQFKYITMLQYPQVYNAKKEIAIKSDKNVDPLYTVKPEVARVYMLYEAQNPGSADRKALYKAHPEIGQLSKARSDYFAANPIEGGQTSTAPRPSARAQALMDAGNFKDPEVKTYLDLNREYQNQQRTTLGLTELPGYGSYSKKPKALPKVKAISIKFPKVKKVKLFSKKPKKVKQYKLTKVSKLKKVKRLKV